MPISGQIKMETFHGQRRNDLGRSVRRTLSYILVRCHLRRLCSLFEEESICNFLHAMAGAHHNFDMTLLQRATVVVTVVEWHHSKCMCSQLLSLKPSEF